MEAGKKLQYVCVLGIHLLFRKQIENIQELKSEMAYSFNPKSLKILIYHINVLAASSLMVLDWWD